MDEIQLKKQEIVDIQCHLASNHSEIGDWKFTKQQEALAQGLEAPYSDEEMAEYYEARKNARAKINELENEIAELEKEGL